MTAVRDIVVSARLWSELRQHLLRRHSGQRQDEQMAFILASYNEVTSGVRLVARELMPANAGDLDRQSAGGIEPTGEFVAKALTRCNLDGWSLIEVHSHPFDSSSTTTFSGIDWSNDRAKMPRLASMFPHPFHHATMVLGQRSVDAHHYERDSGTIKSVPRITVVGTSADRQQPLTYISTTSAAGPTSFSPDKRHSRQVPLLGLRTQEALSRSAIAITGLGGLGSFAALELAHLGVGHITLIDHDCVEESNLNRLIGAVPKDVGRAKADVLADRLSEIAPKTTVMPVAVPLMDPTALGHAKSADILVGCVDNHGARLVLNQLAIRYLIPLVDAGAGTSLESSEPRIGGQVQLVVPGIGCLECRGFLDARQVAFDLASPEFQEYERSHGYGTEQVAPSVVFLNGVVASLQVSEVVALLNPAMGTPSHDMVLYDALKQQTFIADSGTTGQCPTCSHEDGVVGLADLAPLQPAAGGPVLPRLERSVAEQPARVAVIARDESSDLHDRGTLRAGRDEHEPTIADHRRNRHIRAIAIATVSIAICGLAIYIASRFGWVGR